MQVNISRERQAANEATRLAGITLLSRATPGDPKSQSEAALALLAFWVVSEDEAEFGSLLDLALVVTEEDHAEVTQLAADGEFAAAARWLLG